MTSGGNRRTYRSTRDKPSHTRRKPAKSDGVGFGFLQRRQRHPGLRFDATPSISFAFLLFLKPRLAAHEQGLLVEIERRERLGDERFGAIARESERAHQGEQQGAQAILVGPSRRNSGDRDHNRADEGAGP